MRITHEERKRYDEDGFLVREAVFSTAEVAEMAQAAEDLCVALAHSQGRTGQKLTVSAHYVFEAAVTEGVFIKWEPGSLDVIQGVEPFAHMTGYFTELASHPGFVEPMRDLVGIDDVALFTEKLNVKRARVGGSYALHSDFPYWRAAADEPERLVTAWVAVDDATADNGALEVLPGSHRMTDIPYKKSDLVFEENEIDEQRFDTSGLWPVEVAAGGAIFFGPHLVHRSAPNRSDRDRRAILYTYQPAGLRTQLDNVRRRFAST